jgi:CRP-like cAMP-binding protein
VEQIVPGSESFILLISRCEIADYLGMSMESVSRSLGKLNQSGAIRPIGARDVGSRIAMAGGLSLSLDEIRYGK